ncbi:hypothetical protein FGIG_10034 [Fasciola gigantica]|uniref:EF-hand domain-containing protein n=1 Tax=Fasciola gigantica TaxID=46835 RepID=A0A504YDG1_FASGI|nr:hypothetical protein FGIG_10034 [Fasciola gigantica]
MDSSPGPDNTPTLTPEKRREFAKEFLEYSDLNKDGVLTVDELMQEKNYTAEYRSLIEALFKRFDAEISDRTMDSWTER